MKLKIFVAVLFWFLNLAVQIMPLRAETPAARVRSMLAEVTAVQTNPQLQAQEFRNQRRTAIKKIIVQRTWGQA